MNLRYFSKNFLLRLLILSALFLSLPENCLAQNALYPQNRATPPSVQKNMLSSSRLTFTEILPNGIRVVVQERPGTGIVACEVLFRVGVMQEMDTCAGITGLIQAMILNAREKEGRSITELAHEDGCIIDSGVNPDYTFINMVSSPDCFNRNFKNLLDRIKTPVFNGESLEREKSRILFNLENNHSALQQINEIFLKTFYKYHPYRQPVYGYRNTIARTTPESISEFYEKHFTARRMTIAVCGDINGPEIIKTCRAVLSNMPREDTRTYDIPWEPEGQEKRLYLETTSDLGWVFIGFPAPSIKSPDYPKMKILELLLGDGLSSRLFLELREKEGLAYELSSTYPELEGPGHMIIYVVTGSKGMTRSRKKIFDEIKKLKAWKIGPEELEATRRKALSQYLMARETASGQAHHLARYTSVGLGENFDEFLLRKMQDVTIEDIQQMARKYFENFTILEIEPPTPNDTRMQFY